jgi:hypothetical protein
MIPILFSYRGQKKDKEEIESEKDPYTVLKKQYKKGEISHEEYLDAVKQLDRAKSDNDKNNALWIELAAVGAGALVVAVGVSKLL